MAYARRTRRAPARKGYSGRRTYATRSRRAAPRKRRSSVRGRPQTIRLVIQTTQAQGSPVTGQTSVMPLRAQF